MATIVEHFEHTLTTTGAPTTDSISLSSFAGGTPTAAIFFGIRSTTSTAASQTNTSQYVGISDGTNDASVGSFIENSVNTSNARRWHSDAHAFRTYTTGSVIESASVSSFAADTINLSVDASSTAIKVHGIALGGDITSAKVLTIDTPVSDGNQSYTGVGFQPDALILISIGTGATPPTVADFCILSVGYTDGTNEHVSTYGVDDNQASAGYGRKQLGSGSPSACIHAGYVNTPPVTIGVDTASIVSLDADGFTLNWTPTDGNQRKVFVLALAGGTYEVGQDTAVTTTPATKKTTTSGEPRGILLSHIRSTASTSVGTEVAWGLGAATSTSQEGAIGVYGQQGTPDLAVQTTHNDRVIQMHDTNATLVADAKLDTASPFASDGFTLDWLTVDASAREFGYLAFMDDGTPPPAAGAGGGFFPVF